MHLKKMEAMGSLLLQKRTKAITVVHRHWCGEEKDKTLKSIPA